MEDCACVDFNNRCDEHKDLSDRAQPMLTGNDEALFEIHIRQNLM
jgi:hypothetical protein